MNPYWPIILLSLKVATLATLILLPVGTTLGWLFARKTFPGKSLVEAVVNVPLVLPPIVTGYFLLVLLGPRSLPGQWLAALGLPLAFTWRAAVVASAVVSMPLLIRAVRVAIEAVDVKLEDAARMLRANEWQIFFRITLPLAINGIIAGAVLAFARALGEFGATIVFASNIQDARTMPLAIFSYLNQVGGEEKARILVIAAMALAYLSILLNEFLMRRFKHAGN
ncbi:MAG: molybdate ABC transporter permease subunit [bacterium]